MERGEEIVQSYDIEHECVAFLADATNRMCPSIWPIPIPMTNDDQLTDDDTTTCLTFSANGQPTYVPSSYWWFNWSFPNLDGKCLGEIWTACVCRRRRANGESQTILIFCTLEFWRGLLDPRSRSGS